MANNREGEIKCGYKINTPDLSSEMANRLLESVIVCFCRLKTAGDLLYNAKAGPILPKYYNYASTVLGDADQLIERLERMGILEIPDV